MTAGDGNVERSMIEESNMCEEAGIKPSICDLAMPDL